MPIDFTCPHCGKQTAVADRFAGCTGPCAECGQTISVPAFGPIPAKSVAAPPPKPSSRSWAVPVVVVVAGVGPVLIIVLVLVGNANALMSESGILPAGKHINIASCTDGTSNTMIVGEQSDRLRSDDPAISKAFHGDSGWTGIGTIDKRGGWLSGTDCHLSPGAYFSTGGQVPPQPLDPPRRSQLGDATPVWPGQVVHNITTVRYKPDLKRCLAGGNGPARGCDETQPDGHNNPLQSPHPGGVLIAFVDGSVQFISGSTDLAVLLRIAIRNDGQNVKVD